MDYIIVLVLFAKASVQICPQPWQILCNARVNARIAGPSAADAPRDNACRCVVRFKHHETHVEIGQKLSRAKYTHQQFQIYHRFAPATDRHYRLDTNPVCLCQRIANV